jgi:hypothetical protein
MFVSSGHRARATPCPKLEHHACPPNFHLYGIVFRTQFCEGMALLRHARCRHLWKPALKNWEDMLDAQEDEAE